MSTLDRRLQHQLDALREAGLARTPPRIDGREGVRYRIEGRPVVGFCSNDYLGLADHPSFATLPTPHSGATASRLVCGDQPIHRTVAARLAELAGTADAILFQSGFQLNVGVLPAILRPDDSVHSDALNHASLIDGLRLSRAAIDILRHGDAPHPGPFAWWITEALFSMDGDFSEPTKMRAHLAVGGALYLDEAHSFGLFKNSASGRPTGHAGRHEIRPTVLVGTLGKRETLGISLLKAESWHAMALGAESDAGGIQIESCIARCSRVRVIHEAPPPWPQLTSSTSRPRRSTCEAT